MARSKASAALRRQRSLTWRRRDVNSEADGSSLRQRPRGCLSQRDREQNFWNSFRCSRRSSPADLSPDATSLRVFCAAHKFPRLHCLSICLSLSVCLSSSQLCQLAESDTTFALWPLRGAFSVAFCSLGKRRRLGILTEVCLYGSRFVSFGFQLFAQSMQLFGERGDLRGSALQRQRLLLETLNSHAQTPQLLRHAHANNCASWKLQRLSEVGGGKTSSKSLPLRTSSALLVACFALHSAFSAKTQQNRRRQLLRRDSEARGSLTANGG